MPDVIIDLGNPILGKKEVALTEVSSKIKDSSLSVPITPQVLGELLEKIIDLQNTDSQSQILYEVPSLQDIFDVGTTRIGESGETIIDKIANGYYERWDGTEEASWGFWAGLNASADTFNLNAGSFNPNDQNRNNSYLRVGYSGNSLSSIQIAPGGGKDGGQSQVWLSELLTNQDGIGIKTGTFNEGKIGYFRSDELNYYRTYQLPDCNGKVPVLAIDNIAPDFETSIGVKGEIRISGNYMYYCINNNQWVRSILETSFSNSSNSSL